MLTAANPVVEARSHVQESACVDANQSLTAASDPSATDPLGTHKGITVTVYVDGGV
jgi:hypothetical protein